MPNSKVIESVVFRQASPAQQVKLLNLEKSLRNLQIRLRQKKRQRNSMRKQRNDARVAARTEKRQEACMSGIESLRKNCRSKSFARVWTRPCRTVRRARNFKKACRMLKRRQIALRRASRKCNNGPSSGLQTCRDSFIKGPSDLVAESNAACMIRKVSLAYLDGICSRVGRSSGAIEILKEANSAFASVVKEISDMTSEIKVIKKRMEKVLSLSSAPPSNGPIAP